jgi:hypothetical protein
LSISLAKGFYSADFVKEGEFSEVQRQGSLSAAFFTKMV